MARWLQLSARSMQRTGTVLARPEHEGETIRLEAITQEPHRHPYTGLGDQVEEVTEVIILVEDRTPRVFAIDRATRESTGRRSSPARHARSPKDPNPLESCSLVTSDCGTYLALSPLRPNHATWSPSTEASMSCLPPSPSTVQIGLSACCNTVNRSYSSAGNEVKGRSLARVTRECERRKEEPA
jgi:hypothetical protein